MNSIIAQDVFMDQEHNGNILDSMEECNNNCSNIPYFNPKALTILQTDASKKGLGAVLLQNSTPVMFASRALTGSEKNYQNLESA